MTDKEGRRTVSVGERFDLMFEAKPSSGFRWTMVHMLLPDAPVRLIERGWEGAPRDAIGAPGRQRFTFEAVTRGSILLVFAYGRSWEQKKQEQREIVITVT